MGVAVSEKFSNFEWYMQGLTVSSPTLEHTIRGTGEKHVDCCDKLGAIAKIETQLGKSVASLVLFGRNAQSDYEYIRNHLACIMIANAEKDKKREPDMIPMYHLAWLVARMVLEFTLDPELEEVYTKKGRLYFAGIKSYQMDTEIYRKTWRPYEDLMVLALNSAIDEANQVMGAYKKQTLSESKI